jgi:hypothetical protein
MSKGNIMGTKQIVEVDDSNFTVYFHLSFHAASCLRLIYFSCVTKLRDRVVRFMFLIMEVPGLNFGPETGYPDRFSLAIIHCHSTLYLLSV